MAATAAADPGSKAADIASEGDPADRVHAAMDKVLDEWIVTGIHRAGARKFIKDRIGNSEDKACDRIRQWFMLRMNDKVWAHKHPSMCYTPENIPGLRANHVWGHDVLPFLTQVEAAYPEILEELLASRRTAGQLSGFQPYRDPVSKSTEARAAADGIGAEGVDSGAWNVLYLILNHKRFEDNCARFPTTMRVIQETFPRSYSHAFISALTPGSHIVAHNGPSNRMLRCWLPLLGLEGCKLRVGDTMVNPREGHAFAWDHSFEHEVWHEGSQTRFVLIVDIWHPDLTDPEVKFLGTLQNCRLRAGRILYEAKIEEMRERAEAGGSAEDDEEMDAGYFDLVEKARHLLTDDDWWVIKAEHDPTTRPT